MSVHGYSRSKLRRIWNQIYKKDKDKFFARSDVQQSLRLRGHLPLLPHEKAIAVHSRISTDDASWTGKAYQAGFEFLTNFKRPPNTPPIYDTFWGNMGSLGNALWSSILG